MSITDELAKALDAARRAAPIDWSGFDDEHFVRTCEAYCAVRYRAAPPASDDVVELQTCFDMRWKADRRATKLWQEAHPGNDLVWPDHADMVVWLLEELDKSRAALAAMRRDEGRRDIASAPKDGTHIWVTGWDHNEPNTTRHYGVAYYNEHGCWIEPGPDLEDWEYLTHWCPLPAPPLDTEGGGG